MSAEESAEGRQDNELEALKVAVCVFQIPTLIYLILEYLC